MMYANATDRQGYLWRVIGTYNRDKDYIDLFEAQTDSAFKKDKQYIVYNAIWLEKRLGVSLDDLNWEIDYDYDESHVEWEPDV